MSYSKEIYTGIYIECNNPLVPYFIYGKKCCDTAYGSDSKFCSVCGKELQEEKQDSKRLKHKIQFEIPDELEDVMIDTNPQGLQIDKDIYVSNSDVGQIRCEELSDIEVFEVDSDKIRKCFDSFYFDKDCIMFYDECIKQYGKENLEVKFGTVVYYLWKERIKCSMIQFNKT